MTEQKPLKNLIANIKKMNEVDIQDRSYVGLSEIEKQMLPSLALNFYEGKVRQMLKKK